MSLFGTPKAPQEDPAVKAERERQARIAENDLSGQIQDNVRRRTRARIQQFGGGGLGGAGGGFFAPVAGASASPIVSPRAQFGIQTLFQ